MKIYLDSDYRCHLVDDGTMRSVETSSFDGKCRLFIEGYRFIPHGESWTGPDGTTYEGEMAFPVEDFDLLARIQEQYELDIAAAADMQEALEILGVSE